MAKILVIDDDKDTCEFLQDFFQQRKCQVLSANSGEEGLLVLKKEKPDIVLLDIKMPGLSGLDVLKAIKAFDPKIKVIVVTVAAESDVRQKAKELGADDFIRKPLNLAYLEGTVSMKVSSLSAERKDT